MNAKKISVLFVAAGIAWSVFAGGIASLTTGDSYFDNQANPLPRIVSGEESAEVAIAGSWFPGGECRLYVDDVLVATSAGALQSIGLPGAADGSSRTYRLVLKSGEGEEVRLLTLFPSADFLCASHAFSLGGRSLDARPAGTARRIRASGETPIAWSSLWSAAADRSVVKIFAGADDSGTCLGELVSSEGSKEGVAPFKPDAFALERGLYTLSHFDGVETLYASFDVRGDSLMLLVR